MCEFLTVKYSSLNLVKISFHKETVSTILTIVKCLCSSEMSSVVKLIILLTVIQGFNCQSQKFVSKISKLVRKVGE